MPSVSIPIELTSVRWQLDSRGPHDSSAKLTAYVPACDDYDRELTSGFGVVRVLSYGQVAASCGPPRPVTVDVRSAGTFPPVLTHAPTGLYLTGMDQGLPGMRLAPTATATRS